MNYYVIEKSPLCIYRFAYDADVINYFHGYYEETGELIDEHVVVRGDGIVCEISEPKGEEGFVDLEETSCNIDLDELNALVSEISDYYRMKGGPLRITSSSEIPVVLDQLCEGKDRWQKRFTRWVLAAILLFFGLLYLIIRVLT